MIDLVHKKTNSIVDNVLLIILLFTFPLIFYDIYWISALILIQILICKLLNSLKLRYSNSRIKNLLKFVIPISTIIYVALIIKIFFFEVFSIPTASMEKGILVGDRVLVNKLQYGPLIPESISAALGKLNNSSINQNCKIKDQNNRVPGYSNIKKMI